LNITFAVLEQVVKVVLWY